MANLYSTTKDYSAFGNQGLSNSSMLKYVTGCSSTTAKLDEKDTLVMGYQLHLTGGVWQAYYIGYLWMMQKAAASTCLRDGDNDEPMPSETRAQRYPLDIAILLYSPTSFCIFNESSVASDTQCLHYSLTCSMMWIN
ncbi:hypothetical protein LRAMOSA09086 [Lichtheimia ramosa]|uniref:Uncharacterized protein n=1 Tax=Lichtheimia ramosa TaxID=688394 RepID=A0A077WHT4_9FUNG|nr:hypothetical protein LRAMOSA09086 [Lichtheimia ramosa]